MLSDHNARAAADLIFRCWQSGESLEALPADLRPANRAEGYRVQGLLERHSAAPPFGWKIAATSAAGQAHIGVDGPLAGRLFMERAVESGVERSLAGNRMRVAEPEFAFRMARDLPPRTMVYAADEVLDAVGSLHPAIELPNSRFEAFAEAGAPQLLADDACAHEFVLGPAAPSDWRSLDLAGHAVRCGVAGAPPREGCGAAALGDPRTALAWLANELSGLGIPLRAGQVVTTGTCMPPLPVAPGDEVVADFGSLGEVRVRFAGAPA
jgi:2-keto-4-pentenoate hydratase